ncbi:MAG: hypothetical protein EA365_16960 [Gloeocapsa sp. DLM2.Bin57]|nr:MAG: hypothetical protein EA365_16960 [Gloeocapsa sp. DLM2.Bin57]
MFLYRFPWLYLSLVFLAYGVFGWIVAKSINLWIADLREALAYWGLLISPLTAKIYIYGLISLVIFMIIVVLTIPAKSLKFMFGSWLKSGNQGFISILFWSFMLVLIICYLEQFLMFLILFAASLLGRLELQELTYKSYQIMLILVTVSLLGFSTGYFGFIHRL